MAAPEKVDWDTCAEGDCRGVRLPTVAWCLAHAVELAPDAFDAELERIGAEGTVDARGVVISADLLARLLDAVPRDDDRPTFTNAWFERATFEGRAEFHGVSFRGEAGFRWVTFQDRAVFDRAIFQGRAYFGEATFQDRAVFDYAVFEREAVFNEATIKSRAMFSWATFHGPARFDRVSFQVSEAAFTQATFVAMASFSGATFQGETWFDRARFDGGAWFKRTTFKRLARFQEATFKRETWFEGAKFHGQAEFHGAKFQGQAGFHGATFERETWFDGATFTGETWFGGAAFKGVAGFERANFEGVAGFEAATFERVAMFEQAHFKDRAVFNNATFKAETAFRGTTFEAEARFDEATFETARQFGPVLARRQLAFDAATFKPRARIEAAADTLSARGAMFPAGIQLRLRWAQVVLDDADLAAPSILIGAPPFQDLDERPIAEDMAQQPAPSGHDRARPRLLSLQRADVAGLAVANMDLRACRFAEAHNLDRLRLETPKPFARTPGWKAVETGWRWPPVWRWTRREALAEEHEWRARHERGLRCVGWRPPPDQGWVLADSDHWVPLPLPDDREPGRGWRYAGQVVHGWHRTPRRVAHLRGLRRVRREHRRVRAEEIAHLYRALRKGREDHKDEPGAADYYYGEMEMRRAATRSSVERRILTLYWLVSGYALRAWRAFTTLLVVIVAAAGIFATVGFKPPASPQIVLVGVTSLGRAVYEQRDVPRPSAWEQLPDALTFSAESTVSLLRPPDRPLTLAGRWTNIVMRVLGPVLFGLIVLSLRGRVKR